MKTARLYFLDLARAIAALFMVFIHVQGLLALPDVQQSLYGSVVSILGEAPAAPVFMFAMGVSFALSNKTSLSKQTKRGVKILIKGYELNVLRLLVPFVLVLLLSVLGFSIPDTGAEREFKTELLNNLLVVDILQFAGLAYLFITLLFYLKLTSPKILLGVIACVVISAPCLWGIKTGNIILDRLLDPLWGNSGEYVSFPFFSWIAYPLFGVLCGDIYMKSNDIPNLLKKQMIIGLVAVLCGISITLTNVSFHMGDYWRTGPGGMLVYLGFIPIWIYVCERCCNFLKGQLFNIVLFVSKNITMFYIIQWILISSLVALLGQNKSNWSTVILLQIAITVLSYFLTKWRLAWNARKSLKVMSLFLILSLSQMACTDHQEMKTDQLTKMKINEIRLIKGNKDLSEYEKEEGVATLNSIYSFTQEIAYTQDSYYAPYVLDWISKGRKFAGDNPDAQYFSFFIDPEVLYEIDVSHENVFFMEITSYKREKDQNMISSSIVVPAEKSTIIISSDVNRNPDLLISSADYIIMIRYYKNIAEKVLPKPIVRSIEIPQKRKLVDKQFRSDLAVSLFDALYKSSVLLTEQMEQEKNGYVDELEMDNPYVKNLYPAKSNVYNGAFIHIPKDKYLLVKGQIDKSKYAVFVFYNRWWATPFKGESKISINTRDLEVDANDNYEIKIMREDRQLSNALIVGELECGILSIRSIFDEVDEPSLELKSF